MAAADIGFKYSVLPVLLFLWPIGLPLFLFLRMHKVKKYIMEGDEEIHKEFSFVLDDYKTTHWFDPSRSIAHHVVRESAKTLPHR